MASKWVKIGLKRTFFRGTAETPSKYVKKRLFCIWGTFVLVKRRRAHCAGHFWRQNWLYTAFRGVLTPRQAVYSASRSMVSRVSGPAGLPRRVGPTGLAPQGSSCFHCHRPRSARITLVNYQF